MKTPRAVLRGAWSASALAILVASQAPANAAIQTFFGYDSGVGVGGPFPTSDAARAKFASAVAIYGNVNTHNFNSRPSGFYTPVVFGAGDASIAISAPNLGVGYSGINSTTFGSDYGFSVAGGGGTKWLGFPGGSATFTFTDPANAFGAYFTGLNGSAGGSLTLTFNDGVARSQAVPLLMEGGAAFFGFTDTSPFTSLTITRTGDDLWGLDRVAFTTATTIHLPDQINQNVFGFNFNVVAHMVYAIDPSVATGYIYKTGSADPNFESVTLPGLQDEAYQLSYILGGITYSQDLLGNEKFLFPAGGVSEFRVTGIDPSLGLDPNDPTAFVTGVSFVGDGRFTGEQTALFSSGVPEPSTWAMMMLGFAGLGYAGYRKRKATPIAA